MFYLFLNLHLNSFIDISIIIIIHIIAFQWQDFQHVLFRRPTITIQRLHN